MIKNDTYSVTVEFGPQWNSGMYIFDTVIDVYINGNRAYYLNTRYEVTDKRRRQKHFPVRTAMYFIALFDLKEQNNTHPLNKTVTFKGEAPIEKVKQFFSHPDLTYEP